jgi:uncharacterized protein (DUF58 family)
MATTSLIDPDLLRRLELLSLQSRRRFSSPQSGDRRSQRRGLSNEFSDFREYMPGDDLRYVDWKAYGRLEKLFLKLFLDEEYLNVHLLIDFSKSMSFGRPLSKWQYSRRAAAAIGFIALHEHNRVDAAAFSTHLTGRINPLRGNSSIPQFLAALGALPDPVGGTRFADAIVRYAASAPPAGLVIIFSDFFDSDIAAGLASLSARRHQVALVQVLDRSEITPDYDGDLSLVDSETGDVHALTVTHYEIEQYDARFKEFTGDLLQIARKYDMDYFRVVTDEPLESLVLHALQAAGIIR